MHGLWWKTLLKWHDLGVPLFSETAIWVVATQICFFVYPFFLGKMNPFWRSYFSNGLGKNHPTSHGKNPRKKCLLLQVLRLKKHWGKIQRDLSSLSRVCCVSCVRRCLRKSRNVLLLSAFTVFTHVLLETSRENQAKLQNTIDQSPSKKALEILRNDWTPLQTFGKLTQQPLMCLLPQTYLKFHTFVPTQTYQIKPKEKIESGGSIRVGYPTSGPHPSHGMVWGFFVDWVWMEDGGMVKIFNLWIYPILSTYGIFAYIYHENENQLNVM